MIMEYLLVTAVLFLMMLLYFKIADHFNIIDKPNHRSAHTEITLRGGGIIYPISFILFLIIHVAVDGYQFGYTQMLQPNLWIFGAGLLIICTISFIDDIVDLSSKIRLIFHVISVTLLLIFLNVFNVYSPWIILLVYIFIIGILNAYNFMDGINGMSGLYTMVVLASLAFVNEYHVQFISTDFIIYPFLACLVFLFFNFRKKAKCFLGDIGSLGIAFWVMALIGLLMIKTEQLKWILLLSIYGAETILTIIERLRLKENIFDAHRRHLYQLLVNEKGIPHLQVSIWYALSQLVIGVVIIFSSWSEWIIFPVILVPLIIFYLVLKNKIKKEIEKS